MNLKRGFDPTKYEKLLHLHDGKPVLLRSIKPEDELLWLEMFQNFSDESVHNRFFYMIKDTPHTVRERYCDIDHSREIAIVAELKEEEQRRILGVVRLIIDSNKKSGEIAFIVADPWQGLGLGSQIVDFIIEICRDIGPETIYALILPDNYRSINLVKKRGFTIKYNDDIAKATLKLKRYGSEK